jgi:hypothetical protein
MSDKQRKFGGGNNYNPELEKFSQILEFYIIKCLNNASKKTNGDDGLVIAIDSKWGGGKTTFLKMFQDKILNPYETDRDKEYIYSYTFKNLGTASRKEMKKNWNAELSKDTRIKVKVIEYNAWEHDYFNDPFVSLVGQVCSQFPDINLKELETFKEKSRALVAPLISIFLNAVRFIPLIGKFAETTKTSINDIKIILVDEIDRCKPQFAINLLEILKHFFNAKNTVFILALDKAVLAEHVRHYHGYDIDGMNYLSRFFDQTFQLPINSKIFYDKLKNKHIGSIEIGDHQFLEEIREFFECQPLSPKGESLISGLKPFND